MTYYEIDRETEVIVDGSPSGLGAILAELLHRWNQGTHKQKEKHWL